MLGWGAGFRVPEPHPGPSETAEATLGPEYQEGRPGAWARGAGREAAVPQLRPGEDRSATETSGRSLDNTCGWRSRKRDSRRGPDRAVTLADRAAVAPLGSGRVVTPWLSDRQTGAAAVLLLPAV